MLNPKLLVLQARKPFSAVFPSKKLLLTTTYKDFFQKNVYKLLIIFYVIAYLFPIANRKLWIPDEARYAEISREMISSGDWIVPHLLGLNYFEKPIAGYWLNSLSQLLFGETHFAVRFASALCTGLTAVLIFWFTQQLFRSGKKAIAAAVIYLSSFLVYAIGTYSVLDAMVSLWLNLTLVCFYCSLQTTDTRKKLIGYALMGFATGLGFLTKGFISLVLPVIIALPYLVYRRQLSELCYVWISLISLLLISLPWAIAVHLNAPDYWHYFFWEEHIKRFSAENAQHKAPFWYYFPILLIGILPWLGLAPAAIGKAWKNLPSRQPVIFLMCWIIIPFLFFSFAKGKLPTYILPCFAPISIVFAHGFIELLESKQWKAVYVNGWINIIFGGVLSLTLFVIGSGIAGRTPLYETSEYSALIVAISAFLVWCLMGFLSLRRPAHTLWFTAFCPLAFGLLLGWAIPKSTIYSKLPEAFIHENYKKISESKFIFSSDPGVAVSLAWELKRNDIRLYDSHGEFAYGLRESNQSDKYLSENDFIKWIETARDLGDISVITLHNVDEQLHFPKADEEITKHRLTLLYYSSHMNK